MSDSREVRETSSPAVRLTASRLTSCHAVEGSHGDDGLLLGRPQEEPDQPIADKSLLEIIDGIVMMYNLSVHQQLGKVSLVHQGLCDRRCKKKKNVDVTFHPCWLLARCVVEAAFRGLTSCQTVRNSVSTSSFSLFFLQSRSGKKNNCFCVMTFKIKL